ncbi:MAG: hypothetical protein KF767_08090 [Bdellovibrionaceae bacterium]|nr:hypothetical protein [Pseudobdellovibrionaceae bacterium]
MSNENAKMTTRIALKFDKNIPTKAIGYSLTLGLSDQSRGNLSFSRHFLNPGRKEGGGRSTAARETFHRM